MSRRSQDLPGSAGKRHAGPRAAGGTFQKCTELAGCEMHKSFLFLFAMRCFLWKAVCSETGLYRLGRGQQKRSERNLAGALLHSEGGGRKRASYGTSSAPYLTLKYEGKEQCGKPCPLCG